MESYINEEWDSIPQIKVIWSHFPDFCGLLFKKKKKKKSGCNTVINREVLVPLNSFFLNVKFSLFKHWYDLYVLW